MLPYSEPYEHVRDKNRNSVRKYPELLVRAGSNCSSSIQVTGYDVYS